MMKKTCHEKIADELDELRRRFDQLSEEERHMLYERIFSLAETALRLTQHRQPTCDGHCPLASQCPDRLTRP